MRLRPTPRSIAPALLATCLGAGLAACFDLFHSTSGILSACDLDAQACEGDGSLPDAGPPPTEFCAWGPATARTNAAHACAWLGACESPMGHNAFGTCMVDALLAYDCAANPSHPVHGSARAMWDCLWQVASCEDVARCILPAPLGVCGASVDYTSCGNSGGNAKNADVRVECAGGIAFAENCALSGQTCALGAGPTGICAGASQAAGGLGCTGSPRCMGTRLHSCGSDGVDQGVDCASNGAGQCGGFPSASAAQWVACVASGDAGCAPSLAVTCAGGYASSCSSGIAESLDCTELFQTPDAGCMPGTLSPSFDWTSPCMVDPPACTGDACSSDGAMLTGCARGAPFTTSCTAQNLGPCRMISTDVGTAMHAACTVQ